MDYMGPEGLWNSLKGFVERFFRPPPPRQRAEQAQNQQRREETESKKDKAALVAQELQRITPQHWAYDLLKNVDLNKTTLSQHEELADFIIEILRTPDPNKYHDVEWLQKQRDKLNGINDEDRGLGNSDQYQSVQNLHDRLNNLIEKASKHTRIVELEKEKKREEWMPPEEISQEKRRVEAYGGRRVNEPLEEETPEEKKGWFTLANEVANQHQSTGVSDQVKLNLDLVKTAAEKINSGVSRDEKHDYISEIERGFINAQTHLIREVSKTSGPGMLDVHARANNELEKLTTAWEKTARSIVEKTGSEKGRMFDALRGPQAESVEKLIQTDANYRDYWFYHILEPILYNQKGDGHRELYNLYVAGDMDSFLEIVRRAKDPTTGDRIGLKLARRYDLLKNTIFQSHDMDYYAAHPSQEMKEFIGSTSLFSNKYIDSAMQDPLVSMAERAYESALLHMRDTNGNFIPREWLEWEEGKLRASKLDEDADKILRQMIEFGQLYAVKMDEFNPGMPHPSVWNRKQIDLKNPVTIKELYGYESELSEEYRRSLGDLKIAAALKQAKGLALVDQRFLEIISQSRGTGTEYEQSGDPDQSFSLAAKQFNSVPYEGIVRHINPIVHYYTRFRMGGEYYDAFFNMLLLKGHPFPNWDPNIVKKTVEFHLKGDHEGLIKYLQTVAPKDVVDAFKSRLIEYENPFEYSGFWGPWTGWRIGDASLSFDDEEREQAYGTNIKLITAGDWATRQARRLFESRSDVYKALRTEYRNHLLESNNIGRRLAAERDRDRETATAGGFDDELETIWRKEGKDRKASGRDQTYRRLLDQEWNEHKKDYKVLIDKLQKAYIAHSWVKATSRSPLLAARYLETSWVKDGFTTTSKLRNKIIWDILGIDIDEIAAQRTPTSREESGYDRVTELEGTVAAISQVSIRENRDLTDEDFDKQLRLVNDDTTLKSEEKRARLRNLQNAKDYWQKLTKAVLGNKTANQYYEELGIGDPDKSRERGNRMHVINWDQVNRIVNDKLKLTNATDLITDNLLGRNYKTTLFSTEDMGWEYLNVGALGERNPVRRAGDLASHVQFGQLFEEYINNLIVSRPKIDDLTEAQKKMWTAMSGDFDDIAIRSTYRIAETTGLMYKKADVSWKIPFASPVIGMLKDSSVMQMIRGRDRADAWGPNELLEYTQAVGGKQMIPKREYRGLAGIIAKETGIELETYTSHKGFTSTALGQAIGGTKQNAVWEIINMTLFIATLLTIWRAATAKSEEEE